MSTRYAPNKDLVRTSVALKPETLEIIRMLARLDERSVSVVLRRGLEEWATKKAAELEAEYEEARLSE